MAIDLTPQATGAELQVNTTAGGQTFALGHGAGGQWVLGELDVLRPGRQWMRRLHPALLFSGPQHFPDRPGRHCQRYKCRSGDTQALISLDDMLANDTNTL